MRYQKVSILVLATVTILAALWLGVSSRQQWVAVDVQPPSPVTPDSQPPIQRPALSTAQPHSGQYHTHSHNPAPATQPELSPEIKLYIESQRLPQSQLQPTQHPDGRLSLNPKGQFETVSIAVLGEDGEITIVEQQIQPIDDSTSHRSPTH